MSKQFTKYYDGPPKLKPPFYVVSDTHFFHDNIVKYAGRHEQIKRLTAKGQVVLDHNEYMVKKWNAVVGDGDKILHLGDLFCWFKNGREKFEDKILDQLKGEKYLILGNHDREEVSVSGRRARAASRSRARRCRL